MEVGGRRRRRRSSERRFFLESESVGLRLRLRSDV